jgi:hypothetical protein
MQVFLENLKMNRKRTEFFFDLPELGFEPQIFSKGKGDEIKSKQASKRDRTLHSKLESSLPYY